MEVFCPVQKNAANVVITILMVSYGPNFVTGPRKSSLAIPIVINNKGQFINIFNYY
jgi:hypothetical protein